MNALWEGHNTFVSAKKFRP